jgi:hypothetical protein
MRVYHGVRLDCAECVLRAFVQGPGYGDVTANAPHIGDSWTLAWEDAVPLSTP